MNSTTYAKRTTYKPIDFFFRAVVDIKSKKIEFVDAFQILNDRYLGRMSVCNYFFIAENSVRINELNVIALDELKAYHLVMRENFMIPEKVVYSLPITTRFLENEKEFDIFLSTLQENGYKKSDIVLTFDCNTLQELGEDGAKLYARLRKLGFKTCVYGFGEQFNSLDIFAKYKFEYLRMEASYFTATDSKKRLLNMLVKFCATNKIKLIMEGVDTPSQKTRFKREGVKLVTGKAVSKLSRYVTNEFLNLPKLTDAEKEEYTLKLDKQLQAISKTENAELEEIRHAADEKIKQDLAGGKVMPSAPRPELKKSPYQLRLEQQKLAAKKIVEKVEVPKQAELEINKTKASKAEKRMQNEMSALRMYEGGVQSALSLTFSTHGQDRQPLDTKGDIFDGREDEIFGAKVDLLAGGTSVANAMKFGDRRDSAQTIGIAQGKGFDVNPEDEDFKSAKVILQNDDAKTKYLDSGATGRVIEEATKTDADLLKKLAESDDIAFDETAIQDIDKRQTPLDGAQSVKNITISATDGEIYVGHYNDNGQWVDEDGNVYDGYFDGDSNWVSFDAYDESSEGHYNDSGQWVDNEGNIYDGYFDGDGRWIDYNYVTDSGELVANGHFDNKIKKWIPYGYFDDDGNFIKFD